MRVAGVIIAGGEASRMEGVEKPLLRIGRRTVLDCLLMSVRQQVDKLALDVRKSSIGQYRPYEDGLVLLCDPFEGKAGPLGGLVGALEWLGSLAEDFGWLATFAGDCPSVPANLVANLMSGEAGRPVVALTEDGMQNLFGVWPRGLLPQLRHGVEAGTLRSVHGALAEFGACSRVIEGTLLNINTPLDLAKARDRHDPRHD